MGKTAMALNIAENMAMSGKCVGFFSLEMSKQQLVQRLLCARAGIESQKFRRGMLNDQEFRALCVACGELQSSPVFVDDTPGLTLLQMRTKARRMVASHGVQCIFIDYLQLLSTGKRAESRQVEVGEISRGVKAMARELNVPVICLSQLNRGPEDRMGNKPRMSDLRESGSIEQDADVVMLLHREDYYHKEDPNWAMENPDLVGVAELIISKQRNGPTGVVKMSWIAASTKFRDYSDASPPGGYGAPTRSGSGSHAHSGGGASAAMEPKYAAPQPHALASGGGDVEESPFDAGDGQTGLSQHSSAFAGRSKTGPVQNFRDGGGPVDDGVDDELDVLPI
jgi:replicative DNA helicase